MKRRSVGVTPGQKGLARTEKRLLCVEGLHGPLLGNAWIDDQHVVKLLWSLGSSPTPADSLIAQRLGDWAIRITWAEEASRSACRHGELEAVGRLLAVFKLHQTLRRPHGTILTASVLSCTSSGTRMSSRADFVPQTHAQAGDAPYVADSMETLASSDNADADGSTMPLKIDGAHVHGAGAMR